MNPTLGLSGTHSVNTGLIDSVLSASLAVQLTLLVLLGLSVMCWAVALSKYRQIKVQRRTNETFLERFWKAKSLDQLFEEIDHSTQSGLAKVFQSGFSEMQKLAAVAKAPGGGEVTQLSGIDNLDRVLKKAVEIEVSQLETRLNWLATTGSTGPFIGLFGTVWGIMGSFQKIGAMGSASLAVVAPGISEALVTTAIGLVTAIPAVALYNHFVGEIRRQENELHHFATDFLNIAKRNFFREA